MSATYILQLDQAERRALHRQTRKAVNRKDAANIELLHDSLDHLKPASWIMLEMPDEYEADKMKLTSSLELPIDVLVVRNKGNTIVSEAIEHICDGDRIKRVALALQAPAILAPLSEATNELARVLSDASETAVPDLGAVIEAFCAFAPVFSRGKREAEELYASVEGPVRRRRKIPLGWEVEESEREKESC